MTISESAKLEEALSKAFYALTNLSVECHRISGYEENEAIGALISQITSTRVTILELRDKVHF